MPRYRARILEQGAKEIARNVLWPVLVRAARQRKHPKFGTSSLIEKYLTELEERSPQLDPRRWNRWRPAAREEAEIRYYAYLSTRLRQALLSTQYPERDATKEIDERLAWHDVLSSYYRNCMRRAGFPAKFIAAWAYGVLRDLPRKPTPRSALFLARVITAGYVAERTGKELRPAMVKEYEVAAGLLDRYAKAIETPVVHGRLQNVFATFLDRMSATRRGAYLALLSRYRFGRVSVTNPRWRDWLPKEFDLFKAEYGDPKPLSA